MNVERAIEHIVELQAAAEARMERAEARMDRTDRQIAGIQKIIKTGMRLIVQIGQAQKRTDLKMAELAEQQRRTDLKFEKLIEILRQRPPNGRVNGRR